MRYRVRNQDGELSFSNFLELERAFLQGLVEPEDEVLEEGSTLWRKAGAVPLLVNARRAHRQTPVGDKLLWTLAAAALGTIALYELFRGHWTWGLGLSIILSVLLWQLTYRAFKK